jgi:phage shock protein E
MIQRLFGILALLGLITSATALAAERLTADQLAVRLGSPDAPLVIDVRAEHEYRSGHIPGAVLVPFNEITTHLDQLAAWRDRPVVLYCRTGRRVAEAQRVLERAGFSRLHTLQGDFPLWAASGKPVSHGSPGDLAVVLSSRLP